MQNVFILDVVRTPVAKRNGELKHIRPDSMLSHTIKKILERNPEIDKESVEDVIIGCAMPEAQQGLNVARIASLLAGLPNSVPAYTVNRFCSSGLQAIANAAAMIESNQADIIIAGGVESMTQIPMTGNNPSLNIEIFNQEKYGIAYGMGLTAEKVAEKFKINKEDQNQFAYNSHQKAIKAQANNFFDDEIVPLDVSLKIFDESEGQVKEIKSLIESDEGPRKDTSIEALNKLRNVFDAKGSVTAGNSSQMSDGAACAIVVSQNIINKLNLKPKAKFISYAVSGVQPKIMGIGPIKAIPKSLKQANINLKDLSWIELNEAFAAQSLAVIKELDINEEVINPVGGAIALGHPLGATGTIRTATLMSAFGKDQSLKYGMVTMCIGAGMGAAGIFENLK